MKDKLSQRLFLLFDVLFHFVPTKRQVLFICFSGRQYGDNTRALAEYIHDKFPDIKLYWAYSDEANVSHIPSFYDKVKINTARFAWVKNRSILIVENGAGVMLMPLSGIKNILRPFIHKKNQFEIATWHGGPFKKIGADIPGSPYTPKTLVSSANILIASSKYEERIFKQAFLHVIPTDCLGYPRNDVLFNHHNMKSKKNSLNIPSDKKVILFAPTFREDDILMGGINQIKSFDISKLLNALSNRFGGEWVFVYRFHNLVINTDEMKNFKPNGQMINGSVSEDMADYLSVTDILLTDYSSCLFDVVGTDIKCFMYMPDYEHYCSIRGLYMKPEELPFPKANTFEELISRIDEFDEKEYSESVMRFASIIEPANSSHCRDDIYKKYIKPVFEGNIPLIKR